MRRKGGEDREDVTYTVRQEHAVLLESGYDHVGSSGGGLVAERGGLEGRLQPQPCAVDDCVWVSAFWSSYEHGKYFRI